MDEWQQGRSAAGWPCWAFSNHDVPRVATRWGGSPAAGFSFGGRAEPAGAGPAPGAAVPPVLWLALLMSLRGTLCLYQGEELGLPQAEVPLEHRQDPFGLQQDQPGRDGCRTPMPWQHDAPHAGFSTTAGKPWLPLPEAHRAHAVNLQQADPDSPLNRTRELLALRRRHAALRLGRFEALHAEGSALLAVREHQGEQVLLAFNWGDGPVSWPQARGPAAGTGFRLGSVDARSDSLVLGPASALIQPLARS